jgi:hypothetical protein
VSDSKSRPLLRVTVPPKVARIMIAAGARRASPDSKPAIRPTRRTKRVLLVLLTGAGRLSLYPIERAAMVSSRHVDKVLPQLEAAEWVVTVPHPDILVLGQPFSCYELTPYGRAEALALLGLKNADGTMSEQHD